MAAVYRHRKGSGFSDTMGNDDLEEGDHDFTRLCNNPMEDDSARLIILEFLKQEVFHADNNCYGMGEM